MRGKATDGVCYTDLIVTAREFFVGRAIGFLVLALLVGIGLLAYAFIPHDPENQGVACTEEALLCPDGSYVGRGGPRCEFAACPDQSSFVGILRQSATGFDLLIPSPEGEHETSYAMPLALKVSNVVGQIVGKKVEVFGSFSSGNTFQVERLTESPQSDPAIGEIGVGKTVFINGVKVTLNRVVQDSRCPADAECMEGGAINANVTLQSDTDKETRNMASDEVPIAFDSYHISIERVAPPRLSIADPDPRSYVVTFKVVPNGSIQPSAR